VRPATPGTPPPGVGFCNIATHCSGDTFLNTHRHTSDAATQRDIAVTTLLYTGCPRRNVTDFGRVFLMLKYTNITQKNLYPKLNGYGDKGQRKVGASCGSKYCNLHS